MKLIINADDFGASESINNAIIQAFNKKLISSATIMTNMPGFENACKLIKKQNLYGKIGIHLNLIEGYPVTEKISLCEKFCDNNGKFNEKRNRLFMLSREVRQAVYEEFFGQLNKLYKKNIFPTHIDSHHHYHTEWAIGKQVLGIAKNNNINAIRLSRNIGKNIRGIKGIYKSIYNKNLAIKGFAKTHYFGSLSDAMFIKNLQLQQCNIELMVHPGYDKRGRLIELSTGEELHFAINKVKPLFYKHNITSY